MKSKTIVLAFSGGLDTSYCLHHLVQQGRQVHTVLVDAGGIDADELHAIEQRALALGATEHHTLNAQQAIWDQFVKPLIWSKARMRGEYPLLCSDRYVIVSLCLQLCDQLNTPYFAHGCTAMGNDQFRFDQTVHSLGDYQIIAPIRDLQAEIQGNVRDHELAVLQQAGFAMSAQHQKYSINENMLGVTISGSEIDTFDPPGPESACWVKAKADWPAEPQSWTLTFEQGVASALNGQSMAGPELLHTLNQQLAACGIGRHIYTGDVSVGLKGRIVFECPGIDGLMQAHKALEDLVNSKFQNQFRTQVAERWGELVYQGFFYEPHKLDLEAYLQHSQSHVTGTVTLSSAGGSLLATAVDSPYIIQAPQAVYAQSCDWTPEEALGFIKLTGQGATLVNQVRRAS
ncbi:argininosuccinate synthase domain-containing protein [Marinicella meishanensis]|uniref:argininosuccinate synthase domain-containing protein n=1 Tax=Marinicella meishanensis TaxID=2873263 RepID=UPI001CC12E76|nr:argininosuccinate synthase domain-containing protein [Marinicella sp. NBU2979]